MQAGTKVIRKALKARAVRKRVLSMAQENEMALQNTWRELERVYAEALVIAALKQEQESKP